MTLDAVRSVLNDYQIISRIAQEMLEKAQSEKDPGAREYWLGQAAYEMKDYDLAYTHLLAAVRTKSTDDRCARVAMCCWRQGRTDEATDWIAQALDLNPNGVLKAYCLGTTTSYLAVRATIEIERGEVDQALSSATQALKLDKRDAAALTVRANALLIKGDHQLAADAFKEAHSAAHPYLQRQLEAVQDVVSSLAKANAANKPFIAELAMIGSRHAI